MSLNNLADYLFTLYTQPGAQADENLDEAIALGREALDHFSHGYPKRSEALNSLARYLSARYERLCANTGPR